MSKEKQMFEQMAEDILEDYASSYSIADIESLAEWIHKKFDEYATGYRKQSDGEWIKQVKVRKEGKPLLYYYQCSLCGVYLAEQANFCPNCGAKMKGGE